jgi:tight adherence protein C
MGGFAVVLFGCLAISGAAMLVCLACGAFSGAADSVQQSLKAIESYGRAAVVSDDGVAEPSFSERVLTPLLARAVVMGRKLTAAENAARIQHKLEVAGNPTGWTVDRVLAMKVIGFGVGLFGSLAGTTHFGLTMGPKLLVCVGAALLGYVAVNLWLYDAGTKRAKRMQKDLPDAVDLLTISVEAGLGFDAAMAQVARNTEGPNAA